MLVQLKPCRQKRLHRKDQLLADVQRDEVPVKMELTVVEILMNFSMSCEFLQH
jgi:hypothetical protein